MITNPKEILDNLKKNIFAPIYFLQGEEPYFIDQISDFIEANAIKPEERAFNQVVLYGKDVKMADVLNHARRFPMMAERQAVIVKEAQEMDDLEKEAGERQLLAYAENPLASTILVFAHKEGTLDGRKKLGKELSKRVVLFTSKKIYDNQVPDYIIGIATAKGIKINPKNAQMLAQHTGNDLSRLNNELDKVLINLKEGEEVNAELIEKYVGISKEYNVFELQNAIVRKDNYMAQRMIDYFASDPKNNSPIAAVAVLYGFFTKILLFHENKNKPDKDLAVLLRINPFFVKDYKQAAAVYPMKKSISILHELFDTDLKLKGVGVGSGQEFQLLKELAHKIMN